MKILLVYHFFHPDTVISARIFSDLAQSLALAGHSVTVYTCNRCIRRDGILAESEDWNGVKIRRFSRPAFKQGSNVGRLLNSFILQVKWLNAFRRDGKNFDVVILGTDPQFGYMMLPFMRMMNNRVRLIHWAFDLFPEAIGADSSRLMRFLARMVRPFAGFAYRRLDDMVDIGSCMRERLLKYGYKAKCTTLTPWALAEPEKVPSPDHEMRKKLFGDAKIGLLYSGTMGHAHDVAPFIALARECRKHAIDAAFCFAGYGNRCREQLSEITEEDTNIRIAPFASEDELALRLAAADVHLASVRPGWEGIVVPSKFFGSLAMGRPVLFSGSENGELARWIKDYDAGFILSEKTPDELSKLVSDEKALAEYGERAFTAYRKYFSKKAVTDGWKKLLEEKKA